MTIVYTVISLIAFAGGVGFCINAFFYALPQGNARQMILAGAAGLIFCIVGAASYALGQLPPNERHPDDADSLQHTEQRAWVAVETARLVYAPESGRRLEAQCTIRNSGKTPARGLTVDISIEGRTEALPTNVSRLHNPDRSKIDLAAGQIAVIPIPGSGPIRADSVERIIAGTVRVYVYGFIDYNDASGDPHTTEFCAYYNPLINSVDPLVLNSCSDHNEIG